MAEERDRKLPPIRPLGQRGDYFSLAAAMLVVAAGISGVSSALYAAAQAQNKPYSLFASPGMIIAYIFVLVSVVLVWLGASNRPFPPWKRVAFPYVDIEVFSTQWKADMATSSARPPIWLAFGLTITNHETNQPANLAVYYRAKVKHGELRHIHPRGEDWGETPWVAPTGEPPEGLPPRAEWLERTINILPQHTASGYYVARLDRWWWDAIDGGEASLLIVDRVSTQAVYVPAEIAKGSYNPLNWSTPFRDPKDWFWTVYPA